MADAHDLRHRTRHQHRRHRRVLDERIGSYEKTELLAILRRLDLLHAEAVFDLELVAGAQRSL